MNIKVEMLPEDKWQRGPGGHWHRYKATVPEHHEMSKVGYGQTAREARLDLEKQL